MTFQSLNHLLIVLENQPEWAQYQRYRRLCRCWEKMIEPQVIPHTRPLYIQRNILWVATSSAVWAQNLSLQRYSLLTKLNRQLSGDPLIDIRFSSAQWHNTPVRWEETMPS